MSELTEAIREELKDKETRLIYDDDLLNTYIATQIKVLREQRGWTQQKLAQEASMKQERISVLEDVNYSSWTANVLRRLAKAFDLRLTIKFEEFNTYLKDFQDIKRGSLEKLSFEDDPAFKDEHVASSLRQSSAAHSLRVINAATPTKPFQKTLTFDTPQPVARGGDDKRNQITPQQLPDDNVRYPRIASGG